MEIVFNGQSIGRSHIGITYRTNDEADYTVAMEMRVPILFFSIAVKRSSRFVLRGGSTLTHYHCVSSVDFPGYTYTLNATNYGSNVVLRINRGGGEEIRTIPADRYDYLTGNHYRDFLDENRTNRILRFLDLDSVDCYPAEYTLHTNYRLIVNGREEPIYEMTIRSGFVGQKSVVLARNDIPLSLNVYLPVVGWLQSAMVGIDIRKPKAVNKPIR